jgi:hypothetical protein
LSGFTTERIARSRPPSKSSESTAAAVPSGPRGGLAAAVSVHHGVLGQQLDEAVEVALPRGGASATLPSIL